MNARRLSIQVPLYAVLGVALAVMLTPLAWLVAAAFKNSNDLFHYLFFPPPQHLSLENFEKLFGSPVLATGEVQDWPAVCRGLAAAGEAPQEGPARRFWDALDAPQRRRVAATARAASPSLDPADEQALVDAVNAALRQTDLLTPDDLRGLLLTGDARDLADRLGRGLAPADVPRVNRAVFEALFPKAVRQAMHGIPFGRYLMNSLFVAGTSVLLQMFFSSLGGFALAKYEFRGKKIIMTLMLATLMIPGAVLLAPLYELIYRMGLVDSFAGLIVPGMVSVFGMFLFRQSMLQIPDELLEAGRMDGCTEFGLYWHVALPVSRPMTGAFCLVAFMGNWNAFLWPQIVLHTADRFTLPIGLNQMVGTYSQQYGTMMAGTLLAILPVMVLFFILQREFISGLTAGAVKG